MNTPGWAVGLVLLATVVNGIGGVLLKLGADASRLSWKNLRVDPRLLLGLFSYGLASILYVVSLTRGELSVLYPVVSLTYVWIFCLSRVVLGERLTAAKLLGGALLILGVCLVGWSA